eukprot:7472269-Pyramimonas_sp.AAC.1
MLARDVLILTCVLGVCFRRAVVVLSAFGAFRDTVKGMFIVCRVVALLNTANCTIVKRRAHRGRPAEQQGMRG